MWIGFGFKDDLGVFTERFYVWYSVIASVRRSAIVPEICKSVKTNTLEEKSLRLVWLFSAFKFLVCNWF